GARARKRSRHAYTIPRSSAASNPSRRVMTNVATIGYSATIRPFAVLAWYSPKNGYVPGFSARTRILSVFPPGITFSILSSLLSNSSGPGSLLVTTRTKAAPALTRPSSGWTRFCSITIGTAGGEAVARAGPAWAEPRREARARTGGDRADHVH